MSADAQRSVLPDTTTPTARQELADRIITAIAIGAYSPGDRLPPERELAERQQVSRVTVREAIKIVSGLGLLVSRRGRNGGTFVSDLDVDAVSPGTARKTLADEIPKLTAFFDYRCLVEGLVARTAAERHDSAQAKRLRALLQRFCATSDLSRARELDTELHAHIVAMADNAHLAALCEQLNKRATLGFGSEPYPSEYLEQARNEHIELVTAIADRDVDGAERAAREHFSLTLTIMQNSLQQATC